jgi:hypothetical protein
MKIFVIICLIIAWTVGCSCAGTQSRDGKSSAKPRLSDDQLLDSVQYHTFQYFWDGAEPNSGLARERFHVDGNYPQNDKNTVTTGGSGFGLMAILVGIEHGFITREQGFERFRKAVDLLERADRFHGAWPHWMDGKTGKVKPFSEYDDGGDLVETAFLVQGLLAVKNYFKNGNEEEQQLTVRIERLWRGVEWDWYTKGGENILYWHWSPNYAWKMDFGVTGYNECLIMYILAASSPTHPVDAEVYHAGWASNGKIAVKHTAYGYTLPLEHHVDVQKGGPLFWAHYSYLGLNPSGLKDRYADYWQNNVSHTMINRQHCIENPNGYAGYGENTWGLTSSYSVPGAAAYFNGLTSVRPKSGNSGETSYAGHCPSFDPGVITPTAALSSYPYAPNEVMQVIRHFYEDLNDKIWGPYGFYDAFSEEYQWFPRRYLAIDQGPIPVMIENGRSGLLWNLFMQDEDVQHGLKKLGFTSPHLK